MRIPALELVGPVHVLGGRHEAHPENAHTQNSGEEGQQRPRARSNGRACAAGAHTVGGVLVEARQRAPNGLRFLRFLCFLHLSLVLMQLLLGLRSQTHGELGSQRHGRPHSERGQGRLTQQRHYNNPVKLQICSPSIVLP